MNGLFEASHCWAEFMLAYTSSAWSCFSQELNDKYGDPDIVKDLIERKTNEGKYECNPDFPEREDCQFSFHHQ